MWVPECSVTTRHDSFNGLGTERLAVWRALDDLYAWDGRTDAVAWKVGVGGAVVSRGTALLQFGTTVVTWGKLSEDAGMRISAFALADGTPLWSTDLPMLVYTHAFHAWGDRVLVHGRTMADGGPTGWSLHVADGTATHLGPLYDQQAVCVDDHLLYCASRSIDRVALGTGEYQLGAAVWGPQSPLWVNGALYVVSRAEHTRGQRSVVELDRTGQTVLSEVKCSVKAERMVHLAGRRFLVLGRQRSGVSIVDFASGREQMVFGEGHREVDAVRTPHGPVALLGDEGFSLAQLHTIDVERMAVRSVGEPIRVSTLVWCADRLFTLGDRKTRSWRWA